MVEQGGVFCGRLIFVLESTKMISYRFVFLIEVDVREDIEIVDRFVVGQSFLHEH